VRDHNGKVKIGDGYEIKEYVEEGESADDLELEDFLHETDVDSVREDILCIICQESQRGFQLSRCGHCYCLKCFEAEIAHYITRERSFPVKCVDSACGKTVALIDFAVLSNHCEYVETNGTAVTPDKLLRASLSHFLRLHSSGYAYCQANGCNEGIVKLEPYVTHNLREGNYERKQSKSQCSSCGTLCCALCGRKEHNTTDGCFVFFVANHLLKDDAYFDRQKGNREERYCPVPKCMAPVTKPQGCDHTICTNCGVHFCWICTEYTANCAQAVYGHLRDVHGTFVNDGMEEERYRQREAQQLFLTARNTDDQHTAVEMWQRVVQLDPRAGRFNEFAPPSV
jgi:hypothetical protein